MMVVENPQIDEVKPRPALVVLRFDPHVLLICGKGELADLLSAHESLVVVRRRIKEMAKDLFDRPRCRHWLRGGVAVADRLELDRRDVNDPNQFVSCRLHVVSAACPPSPPCLPRPPYFRRSARYSSIALRL